MYQRVSFIAVYLYEFAFVQQSGSLVSFAAELCLLEKLIDYKALTKTMHFVLMLCEEANGSAKVKKNSANVMT